MDKPLIGFIGQGWIGKNYANDFENRGYKVIRYSLDPEYIKNKDEISKCDIVFIAVPTPTRVNGFDSSLVEKVIPLIPAGKIVVIKSTLIPGTTKKIYKKFPKHFILHSPEFLIEASAAHDAAYPERNIIGLPIKNKKYLEIANKVMDVLAKSKYQLICDSNEAEAIKYIHNVHGYFQVVFINLFFDYVKKLKGDWNVIKEASKADSMMSHYYLNPVHKSGRGAGGDCFIKDYKAFLDDYSRIMKDKGDINLLKAIERKNNDLLIKTNKDLNILFDTYGTGLIKRKITLNKKSRKKLYQL